MKRKITILIMFVVLCGALFTGCGNPNDINYKEKPFKEPTIAISKSIVNKVSAESSVKYKIQHMGINNPEHLTNNSDYGFHTSLSLLIIDDKNTEMINVKVKSPMESHDSNLKQDILIFVTEMSSIHYVETGDSYIEIKDSPNKYYEEQGVKYHSYVAEIYLNKNENITKLNSNQYLNGKAGTVTTEVLQLK